MDGRRGEEEEEVIHVALDQIMEERMMDMDEGSHHHQVGDQEEGDKSLLLSRLLSKVEPLERDSGAAHSAEMSSGVAEPPPVVGDFQAKAVEVDEILRELRRLRRQNLITHCLLSVMIVVTVFWQFSEVTFLLQVKKKFSNPFRSIKDMIMGSLKNQGDKLAIEAPPLIPSVPELPLVEFPSLTMHSHEK